MKKITQTKRVLYFSGEHCAQCHYFSMLVYAKCRSKNIPVEEIDAEKNGAEAQKYGIKNVPYVVMLDGDKVVLSGHAADAVKEI